MGAKPKPILAWHFLQANRRLRYGDGRIVEAGSILEVPRDRKLDLCNYGLHASINPLDALHWAPGPVVSRVLLYPPVVRGDDKLCAYRRKHLWVADATDVLRAFARRVALDVIDLWDAPDVVRRYLETGDESIRSAARAAAGAAWYATEATRAAVGAAWYATEATRAATKTTWYVVVAAGDAAWDAVVAAGDAKRKPYSAWLGEMLEGLKP